jgi:lipoyl(octanoyl) transferase
MAVIPSGVEESLDVSEGTRDVSTSLDTTTRLLASLHVYHDDGGHSGAMNMALDEALLEHAAVPSIRFYQWHSPALSFGYFGKFTDVAAYAPAHDLVRRWTGGGIVFHGEDLTYSIVIPVRDPVFAESSMNIYKKIHRALTDALNGIGKRAELAAWNRYRSRRGALQVALRRTGDRRSLSSAVVDRRYNNCFANPVHADVMLNGRKIAGAAQRRTRRGLLQQGSVQGVDLENDLAERFAHALSVNCSERQMSKDVLDRARELAHQKYGADFWLRMR